MRYVRLRANAILQRGWLLTGIRDSAYDPAEAIAIAVFSGKAKRSSPRFQKKGSSDKNADATAFPDATTCQ